MPILWLASFPKSGNTWVRALLANYLDGGAAPVDINALPRLALGDTQIWAYENAAGRKLPNATLPEIMPLKARAHALMAERGKGLVLVKTHTALQMLHGHPTITPAVTAAAVYVLRNPLDVTLSYADHYGLSHEKAVEAMAAPQLMTMPRADRAPEYLGTWSDHVRGWSGAPGLARIVLRYEDLQADAADCLRRMLTFLKTPVDEPRLQRAVANSSFDVLKTQEALKGFAERSKSQARFFRVGKAGQWRDALDPALVRRTIDAHGAVMAEHGYLDANGAPV